MLHLICYKYFWWVFNILLCCKSKLKTKTIFMFHYMWLDVTPASSAVFCKTLCDIIAKGIIMKVFFLGLNLCLMSRHSRTKLEQITLNHTKLNHSKPNPIFYVLNMMQRRKENHLWALVLVLTLSRANFSL